MSWRWSFIYHYYIFSWGIISDFWWRNLVISGQLFVYFRLKILLLLLLQLLLLLLQLHIDLKRGKKYNFSPKNAFLVVLNIVLVQKWIFSHF